MKYLLVCLIFTSLLFSTVINNKIFADDVITINAKVSASPEDYSVSMIQTPDEETGANTEIEYKITYKSELAYTTGVTVQAEWGLGTIEGAPTPTVEMLEYVAQSATPGYNNTPPIINLEEKTITWEIASFPAYTQANTSFKLKTTSNYTGNKLVLTPVKVRIIEPTVTPDFLITQKFKHISLPEASQSPATSPVLSTPTPAASSAPPTNIVISSVKIQKISIDSATFLVSTNENTIITAQYGLNLNKLTSTLTSLQPKKFHTFSFPNLEKNQVYFVQFEISGDNVSDTVSDVYTFQTATQAMQAGTIDRSSFIASQKWGVIYNGQLSDGTTEPTMISTQNSIFDISFIIPEGKTVLNAQAFIRNPNVLGTATFLEDFSSLHSLMTEIQPGNFVAKLKNPKKSGTYEIVVRIEDVFGNVSEEFLSWIHVIKPLTILDKNQKPVWGAEVLFSQFNPKTQLFEIIPNSNFDYQNPTFSNNDGSIDFPLRNGTYKIAISLEGYKPKEVQFEVSSDINTDLPTVFLESERSDPVSLFVQNIHRMARNFRSIVATVPYATQPLFELTMPLAIILCIYLLVLFIKRRKIIKYSFLNRVSNNLQFGKSKKVTLSLLEDISHKPLTRTVVYIIDSNSGIIVARGVSDARGQCICSIPIGVEECSFMIIKNNQSIHDTKNFKVEELVDAQVTKLLFNVNNQHDLINLFTFKKMIGIFIHEFFGLGMEFFLMISILLSIVFSISLDAQTTMPFIAVTALNTLLWLLHSHYQRKKEFIYLPK